MVWLNEEEQRVLRLVAAWFERDRSSLQSSEVYEEAGVSHERLRIILRRLHSLGALEEVHDLHDDILFRPSPSSVDLARELDHKRAEERSHQPDIIHQFTAWVRRQPWLAWPIIIATGLTFLGALFNQWWELIEKAIQLFGVKGG